MTVKCKIRLVFGNEPSDGFTSARGPVIQCIKRRIIRRSMHNIYCLFWVTHGYKTLHILLYGPLFTQHFMDINTAHTSYIAEERLAGFFPDCLLICEPGLDEIVKQTRNRDLFFRNYIVKASRKTTSSLSKAPNSDFFLCTLRLSPCGINILRKYVT